MSDKPSRRWMPVSGYEFTVVDGEFLILQRGGRLVGVDVPDQSIALRVITRTEDRDSALLILEALRATVELEAAES